MKHCYSLIISLIAFSSAAHADEWRSIGNATVVDGWITPGYVDDAGKQLDPSLYAFEVPVEESVENPGMYRLINPFGGSDFHLSEFNVKPEAADLIIDARDRTFVLFQPQYCGFTDADSSEPTGKYTYYLSDMGTYMYNLGQQREVINFFGFASTMRGNIINIPQPTFGTTPENAIQCWDPSFPGMIILPEESEDDNGLWEVIGTATVVDGWIFPGYKDDNDKPYVASEHPFTCKIAFNTDNPNLICLESPYSANSFALSVYNLSGRKTRVIFDITDPEFVKVEPQFSGFIARLENDICPFYITDAGTLLASRGTTKDKIVEQGYNGTYSDEKIVIPMPLFGFEQGDCGKQWTASQATIITWKQEGVTDVTIDESATPEYYNLQGVKVDNPEAGQLYIVRRGSQVSKVIVK